MDGPRAQGLREEAAPEAPCGRVSPPGPGAQVATILRNELRAGLRQGYYQAAAMLAILVAVAVTGFVALERRPVAGGGAGKHPVVRPAASALAAFSRGLRDRIEREYVFDAGGGAVLVSAIPRRAREIAWTGFRPDFTECVRIVFSLLALLCGALAIAPDRERGLLRHLLAHPLGRGQYLLGKVLAWSILACVPLAVAFAGSMAVVAASGGLVLDGDTGARLVLLGLAYLLHHLVYLAAGFAITLVARETATAISAAMMTWLVLALLAPLAARPVARALVPAGSAAALTELRKQAWAVQMLSRANAEVRDSLGRASAERFTAEGIRRLSEEFARGWRRRSAVALAALRLLTPSGAILSGGAELCGTGLVRWNALERALRVHGERQREAGGPLPFEPPPASLHAEVRAASVDLLALGLWLLPWSALSFVAARRLSP